MSETGQGAGGGSMGMKHNYSCGSLPKMLVFFVESLLTYFVVLPLTRRVRDVVGPSRRPRVWNVA
jgi:hypothetical protein